MKKAKPDPELTIKQLNEITKHLSKNTFNTWRKNYIEEWEWLTLSPKILGALKKIPRPQRFDKKFLKAWLQLNFPEVRNHDTYILDHLNYEKP